MWLMLENDIPPQDNFESETFPLTYQCMAKILYRSSCGTLVATAVEDHAVPDIYLHF